MSLPLPFPTFSTPLMLGDGRLHPAWQKFFQGLWMRVGAADPTNGPVTLAVAEGLATTAQSNAETYANTAATTAQSNAETYANTAATTAQSNAETFATSAAGTAQSNAETFTTSAVNSATRTPNLTVTSTAGNLTVTGAQLLRGFLLVTAAQTSNFTLTTDTAANLLATMPAGVIGSGFVFRFVNASTGSTSSGTLAAGTGVMINGVPANPTVASGSYADYLFLCTNILSPAFTVYVMGGSTLI